MSQRVALIGQPLRRRHSEIMHNAAFDHYGIEAAYELREIGDSELGGFFAEARGPAWLGFQVTAPHKQAVMAHLDHIEAGADAIGAVNSGVRSDDGSLTGFNTDAPGFLSALVNGLGADPAGAQVVVVGAGGAGRAVTWALLDAGADRVVVANRDVDRAVALAGSFAHLGPVVAAPGDGALAGYLATADIAVNATTVGMTSDGAAFDVTALPDHAAVFDLVYIPPVTPLLRAAASRGLRVSNGAEMLVRQAEIAFERWTGVAGAADVMRQALAEWSPDAQP